MQIDARLLSVTSQRHREGPLTETAQDKTESERSDYEDSIHSFV